MIVSETYRGLRPIRPTFRRGSRHHPTDCWVKSDWIPAARVFTAIMPNGMAASLTFAQVDRYSDDFAAFLREKLHLEPGARVAIQSGIEFFLLCWVDRSEDASRERRLRVAQKKSSRPSNGFHGAGPRPGDSFWSPVALVSRC